jgi:co-chaperonin GroES (HSP10)
MSQIAKLKQKNLNKSGIEPAGNRVLIKRDEINEKEKDSLIELPEWVVQKAKQGQATGVLIAVGPDAFNHIVERVYVHHENNQRELMEERVKGYSEPFARPGERIAFARYSGLTVKGEDGEEYVILNDEDITARVSDKVTFTDLDTRKPVGEQ